MVGTALLIYGILWQVEHKVFLVDVIDDFFHQTMELRRYEKNYFLYGQENDFIETQSYLDKLDDILQSHERKRDLLNSLAKIFEVRATISEYRKYMKELHMANKNHGSLVHDAGRKERFQDLIREIGKALTDYAENAVTSEKKTINSLLAITRSILLFSIFALVSLSVAMTYIVRVQVINSLKFLESCTRKISRGEPPELPATIREKEIRSLLAAFDRMNVMLQIRQKQLVQSEKLSALGTLLSGVAHELNNPLSNISTSAQILAEEIEDDDLAYKKELIKQIEAQTDRARDIVRTLLEFSRTKEFNCQKLPLKNMIRETMRLLQGQIPSEISIEIDISDDINMFADKQRMQQVFINLVKNAIDALQDQGHIWISASQSLNPKTGKNELEIIIQDDGPGISDEDIKRIFDPFFTTKDVGKGSGLGLFIVHDIISLHGGSINAYSHPGEGTKFVIRLSDREEEK